MNMTEWEGKQLFTTYGIPTPAGKQITRRTKKSPLPLPVIVKSQVLAGNRKKKGGIKIAKTARQYAEATKKIWQQPIDGKIPEHILVEQLIPAKAERYVSISYDTKTRGPVLAINKKGGTGIAKAVITPINPVEGLAPYVIRQAIVDAGLPIARPLETIISSLWKMFIGESALLAEINPLFETQDGSYIAGDAKVILDDNAHRPDFRPYIDLGGDIAILASGGGASMINLDALMQAGGRPANYVEYSGNPKSAIVQDLTKQVLSQKGLRGCWVVGGTANFTDIYETMVGFIEGLRSITPKPTYPIVIRRDGPRQKEAFEMLESVKRKEGFNLHLYGPEIPMSKSAKILVKLSYNNA